MTDIVPELLEKITKEFLEEIPSRELMDYHDANVFAEEVGQVLSKVLRRNVTSDILPDGKMYYNIAKRILNGAFGEDYRVIADATEAMQAALNKAVGLGIKAIRPKINQDRIDGLIKRLADADQFDNVEWILGEPIVNFSRSIVDNFAKENFDFQGKAGLAPKIVRTQSGKCCDWCNDRIGTYEYPVDTEIYRRHERCKCEMLFINGGKKQDVYTKKFK